ncbi:hypothetical protein KL86DYS1_11832 [uncultured Dysgonomonas sp.]|uniref:Uncharacterized protein n=1 Tax=uncultured Dysgonomonas sp. TaxID=206096 RepID=A0A212JCF5_9BACT|nr:hypothetical protein KL86DYS1_11832 [uncultured Dysgonomonas sp.]
MSKDIVQLSATYIQKYNEYVLWKDLTPLIKHRLTSRILPGND